MSFANLPPMSHTVRSPQRSASSSSRTTSSSIEDMAGQPPDFEEGAQDDTLFEFINFDDQPLALSQPGADGEQVLDGGITGTIERITDEAHDSPILSSEHGAESSAETEWPGTTIQLQHSPTPGLQADARDTVAASSTGAQNQNDDLIFVSSQPHKGSKLARFRQSVAYFGQWTSLIIHREHPFITTEIFFLSSSVGGIAWDNFSEVTKWLFVERWTNYIRSGCTDIAEANALVLALAHLAKAHGRDPSEYLNCTPLLMHTEPHAARRVVGELLNLLILSVPHEKYIWFVPTELQDMIMMMLQDMTADPEMVAEVICLALVIDPTLPLDVGVDPAWTEFIVEVKEELLQDGFLEVSPSPASQKGHRTSPPILPTPNHKLNNPKKSDHGGIASVPQPFQLPVLVPRSGPIHGAFGPTMTPGNQTAPLLSASIAPIAVSGPTSNMGSNLAHNSQLVTTAGPLLQNIALRPAQLAPVPPAPPAPPVPAVITALGPIPNIYSSLNAGMMAYSNPQRQILHASHVSSAGLAAVATAELNWLVHRNNLYNAIRTPPQNATNPQLAAVTHLQGFISKINDPNPTKAGNHGTDYDPQRADQLMLNTVSAILTTAFETHKVGHTLRSDQLNKIFTKSKSRADSDRALTIDARIALIELALRQEKRVIIECADSFTKIQLLVCGPQTVADAKETFAVSNLQAANRNLENPKSKKRGSRTPRP